MKPKSHRGWSLFLRGWLLLLLLGIAGTAAATPSIQSDDPASLPPPETVTIAGTIQPEIGCAGQWNTSCAESMLTYDPEDDLWLATFEVPAGSYEYKAALNGTWDDNYGLNAVYYGPNIPLEVPADGPVTFWYDHKTLSLFAPPPEPAAPGPLFGLLRVLCRANHAGVPGLRTLLSLLHQIIICPGNVSASLAGSLGNGQRLRAAVLGERA